MKNIDFDVEYSYTWWASEGTTTNVEGTWLWWNWNLFKFQYAECSSKKLVVEVRELGYQLARWICVVFSRRFKSMKWRTNVVNLIISKGLNEEHKFHFMFPLLILFHMLLYISFELALSFAYSCNPFLTF